MTAQLKYVESVIQIASANEAVVTFRDRETITLVDGENGVNLERKLEWMHSNIDRDVPVAYFPDSGNVLPSTVALGVEIRESGKDMIGATAVVGFPRPSLMYLQPDVADHDRLAKLIDRAVAEGSSAVFALRDTYLIEDIILITREEAGLMLGVKSQ